MAEPTRVPAIYLCGGGNPEPDTESDCPQRDRHTPMPSGYVDQSEWAGQMIARGALQCRCPGCGLYAVWTQPTRPMPTPHPSKRRWP